MFINDRFVIICFKFVLLTCIVCTVGAKEIFTPYKLREHIYKSNV